jgi:hypothetical protein
MFKYRLPFAAMLLAAFTNVLHAQERESMPAELEVSLDRVTKQGIGYHISGRIPLELPNGDDNFVVKAKMRAYWRFSTVYRKCKLGVTFVPLEILGRRDQDRLRLAISLHPEMPRPACDDGSLVEAASKVLVNVGDLNSTEFTLFVADGSDAERTVEDSSHLDRFTGKLALHLACSGSSIDSDIAPAISVLPTDTIQWPLLFDDTQTSTELSALAKTPWGVVGLTRPSRPYPPMATFRSVSRHAALRPGFCFWVKSLQVEFTPIEMLLASKYPAGSCEYNVIREHEMLHYQDLQILFIRYQGLVMSALREAGLPTIEKPAFVESILEGSTQAKTRIEATLQPIYASMEKALLADADARDSPEERMRSWNQCSSWAARFTGVE